MKRILTTLIATATAAVISFTVVAAPEITDVVAKQRYPWNGLVDITCKVTGINGTTNKLEFAVAAVMPDSGAVRKVLHFWTMQGGTKSTDREVHTNGNYHLLWDAQADLGQVCFDNMVVRVTTVKGHGKVQLWEGGPYWAETNIGADEPWEYGYYFWWGDTVGYTNTGSVWISVKDGTSISFSSSGTAASTYDKSDSELQSAGYIDSTGNLVAAHDAATAHLGAPWRMPTSAEMSALISNCTTTWITTNGVSGLLVTGEGAYMDRSIFLPSAGYGGYGSYLDGAGSIGLYWSATPYSAISDRAWCLYFYSGNFRRDYNYRCGGRSVRPVRGFAQ